MTPRAFPLLPPKYRRLSVLRADLRRRPARYWTARGEQRALALFRAMAVRVPAYKDFLRRHAVRPALIKTMRDLQGVPPLAKDTYLRRYPLASLCWDGKFAEDRWTISATSGSTGTPFYFPRQEAQDLQYAATAELYLRTNFRIHERSTLYVNAFPLGVWIGGLFTYEAITRIARRGRYALSVINPGIDKQEIINAVRTFGGMFDQVIIGCYGPFLKDALDEGIEQGVDWGSYGLKFIFSAEGFSETFRDHVCSLAGVKDPCLDTLNHYGTVDQGTLAYETPVSIMVRRAAVGDPRIFSSIFSLAHRLPTLAQYDPELFFFEEVGGGLLCSAASGLPLVRYDLKDHGRVVPFDDMECRLRDAGYDLSAAARRAGIAATVWRLPFVQVYERSDLSVSLYAFQVYPETVRKAVQHPRFHADLTGKFSVAVRHDARQNPRLEVHVELKRGKAAHPAMARRIGEAVVERLLEESSEYRKTYRENARRVRPRVVFWPYAHPKYFLQGKKQKWAVRT